MRVVCSYCQRSMGTKPPLSDAGLTHGMCATCSGYFGAQWKGMSYADYLERFPYPVILVEGQVRVVAVNRAACALMGREAGETVGLLGGEALECVHARLPGGCGGTVHCATCAIRQAVTRTHQSGEALRRVPAKLRRSQRTYDLLISTEREGELVRVTIEPRED